MKFKAFLLVLTFALIWTVVLAPAHLVTRVLPVNAPLVLHGVTGSIWSGAVAQAALIDQGHVLAQGQLRWQIRPLSLLRMSPCVDITFTETRLPRSLLASSTGAAEGLACVSASGELTLRDVAFDLPARRFLRSQDLRLGGEISGLLSSLIWRSGALLELRGQGLWSNATVVSDNLELAFKTLPFDFRRESSDSILVQMDNGELLAQQPDTPLHVSLQSTVTLDGRFHTAAQLTAQPHTSDEMTELLNVLAEPRGAGVYILEMRSNP